MSKAFFPGKFFLIFLVIFILLIVIKFNILTAPFHWDAMGYVISATENVYDHGVIINKTGSTGHPPLFLIALASAWKIFGKSLLVSHLFNIFLGALGLTFLFFLAGKLYGDKVAVVTTLLLFFNQTFFSQVGIVYLSIALMSMAILSVYFYVKQKYLLYIISASLMLLVKETTIVILISILIFDFFLNLFKKEKVGVIFKKIVFLSLPIFSLLTWFFAHYFVTGWIFKTKAIFINKGGFIYFFVNNFIKYLIYDFSIEKVNRANWIIFVLVIMSFVFFIKKRSFKYEILFLLIIVINVAFFSLTDDLPRYFIIIFPFYLLMGARASVMLTDGFKYKNIILLIILLFMIGFSVMNYYGTRNTDGWRLESNMEYLDMVKLHKKVCKFIEKKYFSYKIVTNFPLTIEFRNPWYGYVEKPIKLIHFKEFNKYNDVLVVWSSQSNFLNIRRFIELNKKQLDIIKYFSYKGKIVKILKKKELSKSNF